MKEQVPKSKKGRPFSGKKLLIIEDEKILMEMYYEAFVRAGFRVSHAVECKKGIELAKKERPDLIVLDIILPHESGIEFLKKQHKDPEISAIPVIIFSNYDEPNTRDKAMKLGAEAYLIKANYTPGQAAEKIGEYLK